MGQTNSKKKLTKFDFEIACEKVYQHIKIQRDRKINILAQQEIQLREKIKSGKISIEDVKFEMLSIVNLFKYIQICNEVIRYSKMLKDRSIDMTKAQNTNDYANVQDLKPYFDGIIWSASKLNLNQIKEFHVMCVEYFGVFNYTKMCEFKFMDKKLKCINANVEPSPREVHDYLDKFLIRYKLQLKGYVNTLQDNNQQQGNGNSGGEQSGNQNNFDYPVMNDYQINIDDFKPKNQFNQIKFQSLKYQLINF